MTKKIAIVTGAARGIGLATTRCMLDEGWQVAMVDRDGDALSEAVTALDGVHGIDCDVSDPGSVKGMISETLRKFGQIEALKTWSIRKNTSCAIIKGWCL